MTAEQLEKDLAAGRRVLEAEAAAVKDLAGDLDESFSMAVDVLLGTKGRVIVSGMGKSGHIARKIAATLASTGTPAQHVHPSEASHGDLGMITAQDSVILISNSGENQESGDLIAHTRLLQIPLIGISSRRESTLIQSSDIGLILANAPEACPMGKAPTTSSTMTLALGDALAVALMERRGFNVDNYKVLHPGGKLGQSLVRVGEVMHTGEAMPLVSGNVPMSELLATLVDKRFGHVGILDDKGRLIGIFTDGDLGRHLDADLMNKSAFDVMTKTPKVMRDNALVEEALALMKEKKIWGFFVFDHGSNVDPITPRGFMHIQDCIKAGFE